MFNPSWFAAGAAHDHRRLPGHGGGGGRHPRLVPAARPPAARSTARALGIALAVMLPAALHPAAQRRHQRPAGGAHPAAQAGRAWKASSRPSAARRCASAACPIRQRASPATPSRFPTASACWPSSDPNAEVTGLLDFPPDQWPPIADRPSRLSDHGGLRLRADGPGAVRRPGWPGGASACPTAARILLALAIWPRRWASWPSRPAGR